MVVLRQRHPIHFLSRTVGGQLLARDYMRLDQKITDDYKDYISKLSDRERWQITDSSIHYFGNTNGQHAVAFDISRPPFIGIIETIWTHILIYDDTNQRIKVAKYKSGESLMMH